MIYAYRGSEQTPLTFVISIVAKANVHAFKQNIFALFSHSIPSPLLPFFQIRNRVRKSRGLRTDISAETKFYLHSYVQEIDRGPQQTNHMVV